VETERNISQCNVFLDDDGVRLPVEARVFTFSKVTGLALEPSSLLFTRYLRLFLWGKFTGGGGGGNGFALLFFFPPSVLCFFGCGVGGGGGGCETVGSPFYTAKIRNEWSCAPSPPCAIVACIVTSPVLSH